MSDALFSTLLAQVLSTNLPELRKAARRKGAWSPAEEDEAVQGGLMSVFERYKDCVTCGDVVAFQEAFLVEKKVKRMAKAGSLGVEERAAAREAAAKLVTPSGLRAYLISAVGNHALKRVRVGMKEASLAREDGTLVVEPDVGAWLLRQVAQADTPAAQVKQLLAGVSLTPRQRTALRCYLSADGDRKRAQCLFRSRLPEAGKTAYDQGLHEAKGKLAGVGSA